MESNFDPENPNANSGVFLNYILNQFLNKDLQEIDLEGELKKAQIEALSQIEKSNNIGNFLQQGLGMVGQYFANKPANSKKSNTSTATTNNFWTNPSLSGGNLFNNGYLNSDPKTFFNL